MSGKSVPSRSKRPEKENQNSDSKQETKSKQDFKGHETFGKSTNRSSAQSINIRERDKNHNSKDPKIKTFLRGENGNVKKRDSDRNTNKGGKIEIANPKLLHHAGERETVVGATTHGQANHTFYGRDFTVADQKKNSDHNKAFADDSRFSKFVKRLMREDDRDKRLTAGKQLRDFLLLPENAKVAVLKADSLLMVLQDIFNERTYKDVKLDAAYCMGTLGSIMGSEAQRYTQWIFAKLLTATSEETKILFLTALQETLKIDETKQTFADLIPLIMTNVQSVLENADTPDLLTSVVTLIMHFTKFYPHVFSSHFKDTVDILVGWHIDSTQKEALTRFTSESLISLQQFWMTEISFSVTLLGQFLEDMEAYAEDLGLAVSGQTLQDDDLPTPEECVTKIAALLKVFTTVVRSLGDYFVSRVQPGNTDYLPEIAKKDIKTVERIIKCVENSSKSRFCEKVLTAANICLTLMVSNLQTYTVKCCAVLLPFIMNQLNVTNTYSNKQILALLNLLHKVCEQVNTKLPVDFMAQLLGSDSLLLQLRFHQNQQVLVQLMAVYHVILGLKNVPLLEEAYRFVLGDLELSYNCLLRSCDSETRVHLVSENPFKDDNIKTKKAEAVCIFSVCALAEISNTKNNLIGMWALSPSIFDLLSNHLLPGHGSLSEKFPAVQYAVLNALYSHCSRHGHHISSSILITQNTVLEGSLLANVSPATNRHFSTVLNLLVQLLSNQSTSYNAKLLTIQWSHEVIEALQKNTHVYRNGHFSQLLQAVISTGYCVETAVSLAVCRSLQAAFRITHTFSPAALKDCVKLCACKLSDSSATLREAYTELLKALPLDITLGYTMDLEMKNKVVRLGSNGKTSCWSLWLARHNHMIKMPSGTFHSHNFRSIMGYILHNIQPSTKFSQNLDRIFHCCQRSDRDSDRANPHSMVRMVDGSESLQWFWATWEAAQFCILSKLRTPLGKPQETFTTIEAAIRKYASQLANQESEDNAAKPSDKDNGGSSSSVFTQQLRVSLVLQFMENLEKLLYNAYEGCVVAMPASIKAVKTFFRTNKNTCVEWLNRTRLSVLIIALHSGHAAMAVRQAHQLLSDMVEAANTQSSEFDLVVMYLVQALCELRCPDALQGVYSWCKEVVGKRVTWIKTAVDFAAGRYEASGTDFKSCLKQHLSTEALVEDAPRKSASSPVHSPLGSPKQSGLKLSILSKHAAEPEPQITNFLANQVAECYTRLNDLDEVLEWQETLQQYRLEHSGNSLQKAFTIDTDINYIRALSAFDDLDFTSARDHLELVPGASVSDLDHDSLGLLSVGWDVRHVTLMSQQHVISALTACRTADNSSHNLEKISLCLQRSERLCQGQLRVGAQDWPPKLAASSLMTVYATASINSQLTSKHTKGWLMPLSEDVHFDGQDYEVGVLNEALRVVRTQNHMQHELGLHNMADMSSVESRLQLAMVGLCRKQHNFLLAEKLLIREMTTVAMTAQPENGKLAIGQSVLSALSAVHAVNSSVSQLTLLRVERQTAKLLHAKGKGHEAMETLSASIWRHSQLLMQERMRSKPQLPSCCDLNARSLLSLVQWLQSDHKFLSALMGQLRLTGQGDETNTAQQVAQHLKALLELETDQRAVKAREMTGDATDADHTTGKAREGITDDDTDADQDFVIGENSVLGDSDLLIGRLMRLATVQSPDLAKAWFTFAGWCYKWGRKAVDNASRGTVELSTDEKAEVLTLLPDGTSHEETEAVLSILSHIHSGIVSEEDISDQDQSLYDDGTETTRRQLLSACVPLQTASEECVESLLSVWRGLVLRVYRHYQLSAKAYFTYLKLNGQGSDASINMDGNITATLRLLRLLVKHAWELRGVLEDGLANTPTTPWKGIIPQLFSRLNHPEAYVRQSVSDLLCRVALDAPHLIVYPAVVGCSRVETRDSERDGLLSEYLMGDDEDKLDTEAEDQASPSDVGDSPAADDGSNTMLQNCFSAIVDTLSHHNPRMISEVQQLVEELRRITVLWDELWLGTLNQHHQDVSRRLQQLENEVKKVMSNTSLSKDEKTAIIHEKHSTVLKPTLFSLERLREISTQAAETPHERWFQQTYGKSIEDALSRLRSPANPASPHTSWQLFKSLHHNLQQRAQKRTSLILKMDEISSRLSSMQGTVIAMPGLTVAGQVITIEAIHNTVQILPTKTKPKKLIFIGSDGRKYPYLFKGLEDLHLDERIMQFLAIVNNMLAKVNRGDGRLYHARHYSVTPLGSRSGLIQWVDGATPLFSLYKRWQQREAIFTAQRAQQANQSSNPPTIMRPGEVFYSKLTPLLKDKGLSLDSRKEWPLAILRRVLEDLMEDTPTDLLAKELWCSSTSPSEWWQITQTYARSTAVMSMIGYIIGLGDRHLDNVLVDLSTGEVVHIDYNVCFEKGKSLRVPEKVPFRMTQNLQNALGVTGVEGTFRISCEHVVKTMRKGRETLLTLLEAFVYDPLVDWTTGNEGGYTGAFNGGGQLSTGEPRISKQDMERQITLSMFSIRIAEMKAAWLNNQVDMAASLPQLVDSLTAALKVQEEYEMTEAQHLQVTAQRQYLTDARTNASHPLYTLTDRYSEYTVVRSTREAVQTGIQEKLNECENWQKLHQYALHTIQGHKLQKLSAEVASSLSLGAPSYAPVVDFLQSAGQGQMVAQCEAIDTELLTLLHQRHAVMHKCVDMLHTYSTIVSQLSVNYLNENRTTRWQQWLHELLCDFTSNKCKEIVIQCQDLYSLATAPDPALQAVLNTESKLKTIATETNAKRLKLIERRNLEGLETDILSLHVQETTNAVHCYVKENGMSGGVSLASVVVSALCSLNKRYLVMEGAAAAAGDRLMDLTSREGDWFLDELCSMSGNVNQLLALIRETPLMQSLSPELSASILPAMQATHTVYMALLELNVNFRSIIVPESVKTMQAGEASVAAILSQLWSILAESNMSLDALLTQLELILRNTIMGMQVDTEAVSVVRKLRERFEALLAGSHPDSSTAELTAGQMLLMGFNGLFTQLDSDFLDMLDAVSQINVPDVWKKMDVIKESRSLQLSAFNESTLCILSSLFFVKRLQAMQSFFSHVQQYAVTLGGKENGPCYDEELLAKPIKHFIAEYVRKQVIGIPSQTLGYILCIFVNALQVDVTAEIELRDIGAECKVSLEDLCKKALDGNLRAGAFQPVHLTQASALITSTDAAWRKQDLANRLDNSIGLLKACLQRAQLQVARYQWQHEDIFTRAGHNQLILPTRANVMAELQKNVQTLMTHDAALVAIQERHTQIEASITQRLKWAAGANPSLNPTMVSYEETLANKNSLHLMENKLCSEITSVCNAILHFEALRTRTPEAMSADASFLSLMNKCEESCVMSETCGSTVSEEEDALMRAKPLLPEEAVTPEWIKAAMEEISKENNIITGTLTKLFSQIKSAKEAVKTQVAGLRNVLTTHHKLMSDLRSILKSLCKQEEQDFGTDFVCGGVREYVSMYRAFSENFSCMLKMVTSESVTQAEVIAASNLITGLTQQLPSIYGDLVNFAPPLKIQTLDADNKAQQLNFATALKKPAESAASPRKSVVLHPQVDSLMTSTPPANSPQLPCSAPLRVPAPVTRKSDKVARDPRTGKAIQERNSYAVSVWRRVKMKLDGRDPDLNKRLTVPEQVDFVIREATNLDNLSVLYEGWTPWV